MPYIPFPQEHNQDRGWAAQLYQMLFEMAPPMTGIARFPSRFVGPINTSSSSLKSALLAIARRAKDSGPPEYPPAPTSGPFEAASKFNPPVDFKLRPPGQVGRSSALGNGQAPYQLAEQIPGNTLPVDYTGVMGPKDDLNMFLSPVPGGKFPFPFNVTPQDAASVYSSGGVRGPTPSFVPGIDMTSHFIAELLKSAGIYR